MAKAKKFPAEIFVRREYDQDYPYLVAHESLDDEGIDDGERVAIYKLVSVKTMRVKGRADVKKARDVAG